MTMNLGPLIKSANNLIEKELNNQMHDLFVESNLTGPQVALMVYLHESDGREISQKEIETEFSISHPTVRGIVKRLVKQNLITTSTLKSDRRQVILSLSPNGSSLIKKHLLEIYQIMDKINHKITADLSIEEQKKFADILQRIVKRFD